MQRSVVYAEDGTWRVLEKAANGDEKTADTVSDIEGMAEADALAAYQGFIGDMPNKRRAAVTLLCLILRHSSAELGELKGSGNPTDGQLPKALKDEFQQAEDRYFGQFMDEKHPLYKSFTGKLPKTNERGDSLDKESKSLTLRERFSHFKTATRKEPSYAANKNLVLNYFAFVGQLPYKESKDGDLTIVPPEVMRVLVANAKNVTPRDNSWAARFKELVFEVLSPADPKNPVKIAPDQLESLIAHTDHLLNELKERENMFKAAEASRTKVGDVKEQTQGAVKLAATPPGPAVVKAPA